MLKELGLFETHVHTANLERAAEFYGQTLGLEPGLVEENRRARFYWLGGRGKAMLGVWEKPPEEVGRRHFAWHVPPAEFPAVVDWLKSRGVKVFNFTNTGEEPLVLAWMPAVSIYFQDPDGNSLEVLAMLPDEPGTGLVPWAEWEREHGRG